MRTTRQQRKDYLKSWIKANPNASKTEVLAIKKMLADLGKKQHEELRQSIESRQFSKSKINTKESNLSDIELVEDDFVPTDLN
jgi:hypothetical protein